MNKLDKAFFIISGVISVILSILMLIYIKSTSLTAHIFWILLAFFLMFILISNITSYILKTKNKSKYKYYYFCPFMFHIYLINFWLYFLHVTNLSFGIVTIVLYLGIALLIFLITKLYLKSENKNESIIVVLKGAYFASFPTIFIIDFIIYGMTALSNGTA